MLYKKIVSEFGNIEKDYRKISKKLEKSKLLSSDVNKYFKSDRDDFKKIWKEYIKLFNRLKYLIKKSKYRKYIIFIDYNKLVIKRYIVIFYFNILVDLLKSFGKHEGFIRVFLDENFRKDYGYYARFIYHPNFVNLINTPNVFLSTFKRKIDKNLYFMFDKKYTKIKRIGRALTDYKNAFFYIKYRLDKLLMIISKKIGFVIAHTKFSSRNKGLITNENIKKYLKISKPGDIFLTRGNWNASNLSIPGFWKHMSMYIGTGKFLRTNFKYKFLNKLDDKTRYIIEATGEGIKIVELDHLISRNDYLGVSRTTFKKEKVYRSIKNALSHVGKSYDHIFNFYSDNNLVCSELIMKSYAKEFQGDDGIDIELEHIGISLTYPPNSFIKKLLSDRGSDTPQVKPKFFIDSVEKTHKNFISTKKEFLKSGKRPKLSLFLK